MTKKSIFISSVPLEFAEETDHVTDHVKTFIQVIRGDTLTRDEIMDGLGLKNRGNLRDNYIKPAVSAGYVTIYIRMP